MATWKSTATTVHSATAAIAEGRREKERR